MKLRFYTDLWPGINPHTHSVMASTTPPSVKPTGTKRIAFDVVIPDAVLFAIDAIAPEVSKIEVIDDGEDHGTV